MNSSIRRYENEAKGRLVTAPSHPFDVVMENSCSSLAISAEIPFGVEFMMPK